MIFCIYLIVFFYNFSAKLKHFYLDIKNGFATDNKYLAVITDNGILIKDEFKNNKFIINANLIEGNILKAGTAEELAADEQVRRVYLGQNFVLRK